MKIILRSILLSFIALGAISCESKRDASIAQKCEALGYKKGTEAFATCMTNQRISKENQFIFRYEEDMRKDER